jgi:uncharacterized protein YgbK (DUF1537 family)
VRAFTSDSRHLAPAAAAARVRELLSQVDQQAGTTWYKKIDSTLRGNIGAEIEAMLDTLKLHHAVVAPAFPAYNRGLRDGILVCEQIAGEPPHLPSLLQAQSRCTIGSLSIADVRAGRDRLVERLRVEAERARLIVADALSERDLEQVAAAAECVFPRLLWCGSAGLFGVLAARSTKLAEPQPRRSLPALGRALLVVGSGSTRAHEQIAALKATVPLVTVQLGKAYTLPPDQPVVVHLPVPPPGSLLDSPSSRMLASSLAAQAVEILEQIKPSLLVLVGGDTAISTLALLGIHSLDVRRELLPGIVEAEGTDAHRRSHVVVLKAGNHGDSQTLIEILKLMQGNSYDNR